jgi:hypothetical protein
MAAIITDNLRIARAKNFVSTASSSNYYSFIGLPNPTEYASNWNESPLVPKDSFEQELSYWDTMIALKKIYPTDIRQAVRKIKWESGIIYDMYRHDIARDNVSKPSGATSLYSSNFYVVNNNYQVYVCLYNGVSPENQNGRPSQFEPTFTDLEPRTADIGSDGYIWKYLFTLNATDIVKFDSVNFIPVPMNWGEDGQTSLIKNNATTSGQIKTCVIRNRGNYENVSGVRNRTFSNIPIRGDGSGALVSVSFNDNAEVENIFVTNGGSNYTYGTVDLIAGGLSAPTTNPVFDVIIPPKGGHGFDVYRELGAFYVSVYSRIENDLENPDFITGNEIARIGIVENPEKFNSTDLLNGDKVSALSAIKLVGITNSNDYQAASFTPDSFITQTVGTGVTAVGRVISYDKNTGILKYWQDKTLVGFATTGGQAQANYGFNLQKFTASPSSGGSLIISGGSINLNIDVGFGSTVTPGITTVINNKTYKLGQSFINGISNPEVKKYSGNIIYVDNRPAITRSQNQKEDIKVILQF